MDRRPTTSPTRFAPGRTIFVSALVASLAAAGGCSSTNPFTSYNAPQQQTKAQQAQLAKATLDINEANGAFTEADYISDAQAVQLPHEWLTEAWNATAEHEARRVAAQAESLRIRSHEDASFARADFDRQGSMTRHEIELAEAEKLQRVFQAKLEELDTRADAQANANSAESVRQDELLSAAVKEWESEVEKLDAQGHNAWLQAQAEHERMLVERDAVEDRGLADIRKMDRVADLTSDRAAARVAQLRAEAETIADQTSARAAELRSEIETTRDRSHAEVADLRQQASSTGQQGSAEAAQLRAQAVAISEQDVDETFRLMVSAAEASFAQSQAEAERLFSEADSLDQNLTAEVARRISDAQKGFEMDRTDHDEAQKSIEAFVRHGKAEVAHKRVSADTFEKTARAEFVKAEARARAAAILEQAAHQTTLAEEEAKRVEAEAKAEASRVEAEFFAMLAKQQRKNSVSRPGATAPEVPGAESGDANPELADAPEKGERLDPKHVAKFKAALAQSQSMRKVADAEEQALFATAEERRQSFDAWFAQREAAFAQNGAEIERYRNQTRAQIETFTAQAESMLRNATAELGRAQMNADAQRRDSLAQINNLNATAVATDKKTQARRTQLSAQADAAERNGASQVRSLEVILASTQARGNAQVAQLNATATSLEQSQGAVVQQMRQEIRTAQQVLSAELAKLDQQADSFFRVAQATFQENEAVVTAMGEVNEATRTELAAANTANTKISEAEVAYLRDLNLANQLVAQASVERVVANAEADLGVAQSYDAMRRAGIEAQSRIAGASVAEQWAIADASERTTRSLFESRIVATLAERNASYADLYEQNQQNRLRLEQAMANAAAYRELSQRAMTNFAERSEAFTIAAQDNWFSQLAKPLPFGGPDNGEALNAEAEQLFNSGSTFVDVPVDDN